MCGIAGILTAPGRAVPDGTIDAITDVLGHRGPDARGVFRDRQAGLHLGHRRLSIVDLSPAGAQPMSSSSGRHVIVLNGEIYNHRELRADLERDGQIGWLGTSDTEVLLELCERHGVEVALQRAQGMFAFALWCRDSGELVLARDRFGEKPLFVAETPDGLVFGSELESILAYPGFSDDADDDAIDLFLQLSYIPEPLTPFRRVRKLPAGCFARLKPGDRTMVPQPYWQAGRAALEARAKAVGSGMRQEDIIAQLSRRLQYVVERQMVADVPVGAFLSGGIDSTLVVALMQRSSPRPVQTFTIGFKDEAYDEAPFARAVAKHLGTAHTEVILDWREALDLVESLPDIYSEPFADSSQLPTYLVSRVARQSVTVCLSGDAGDEIFGGYNRHLFATQYERARAFIPSPFRRSLGHALVGLAQPRRQRLLQWLKASAGKSGGTRLLGEKLEKLGSALHSSSDLALYASLVRRDGGLVPGEGLLRGLESVHDTFAGHDLSLAEIMMLLDTLTYLPGDILTKVDRAAMAVSLETRIPFLDHEVLELAWSLPISTRISEGRTKNVLRGLLNEYVPPALVERPKAGFGVPIESWLKGPLRGWITDQVQAFSRSYPRHATVARAALASYLEGRSHGHHFLWNIAMLQAWQQRCFHQTRRC